MVKAKFARVVRLNGCAYDMGIGVGVLYRDEIEMECESEAEMAASLIHSEDKLIESLVAVETTEINEDEED